MTKHRSARPYDRCGSPRKRGKPPCGRPAGWGTAHAGVGRCKLHGGLKKGGGDRRVRHGLHSQALQQMLTEKLAEWDAVAAGMPDLSEEIGTLRAMVEHVALKPRRRGPPKLDLDATLKVFDRLIKAVDAQNRAQRRGMVSLAAVQSYTEALGLVIAKHVKDLDILKRIEQDAGAVPLLAG